MEIRNFYHIPVLAKEVISNLAPKKGGTYIDCTLGGGGHTRLIAERIGPEGRIIGIDQDNEALEAAKNNLKEFKNIDFVYGNFKDLDQMIEELHLKSVDGILIDLGVSSYQLDRADRGFSFKETEENLNANLDMRMDQNQTLDAYEVINFYPEKELARIFYEYGEEKFSRPISREIIRCRKEKPVKTIRKLLEIIEHSTPPKYRYNKKPGQWASNVFRAIRIEVNRELAVIEEVIPKAISALSPGGKLVIISFHSLEDRIVKNIFKEYSTEKSISPIEMKSLPAITKTLTRKPVIASPEEIKLNPRSNCAKLRAIEKL